MREVILLIFVAILAVYRLNGNISLNLPFLRDLSASPAPSDCLTALGICGRFLFAYPFMKKTLVFFMPL